jgi:curli biogenesis system outer membrane secretion channel CsgG
MNWREYETRVFQEFQNKYSEYEIGFDQKLIGRFSKVPRQIDILVKARIADVDTIGVFDCKCFNKSIDVKVVDSMFGFIDDLGANFGGVVTTKGFSSGAKSRASAARIDLRVITFSSPETVIDEFVPKLDFSDPRNSMYLTII